MSFADNTGIVQLPNDRVNSMVSLNFHQLSAKHYKYSALRGGRLEKVSYVYEAVINL